jgi:four helix bundle protein
MEKFHDKLKIKIDEFVHLVYGASKGFPKEEIYGVTSQMRRAALSVMLNYVEGFARIKPKVNINFLETAYGSLKETKYLLYFSLKENYLTETDYQKTIKLAEEIGAMPWKTIESLKTSHNT